MSQVRVLEEALQLLDPRRNPVGVESYPEAAVAYVVLIVAGLFEVVWALGLKSTEGFTKLIPSLVTGSAIVVSMVLLARASRTIPIGTAYATWVGIGVLGAAIGGAVFFDEAMPPARLFFLLLLLVSIIGIKVTSNG